MTTINVRRSPNRALTLVEPVYRPLDFIDEMERLASSMWETTMPVSYYTTRMHPRLDMFEEKDELVIRTDLPGIKKEDIDISLEGDCLNIRAEKKEEEVSESAAYYSRERNFGTYSRSVSLPFPVGTEHLSATFQNGMLEVRLPKAEEAKAKHIEVQVK